MHPRRMNACGKQVFAIRGQLQAVAGGWEFQVLYELDAPPVSNTHSW